MTSAHKHLKQLIPISSVLLLAIVIVGACKDSSTTWQRIQEAGTLRVGLDPTYPPFESLFEGELQGIDVDLASALAEDLNLRVSFSHFGYDGLYDALFTDQVDVLMSAMVVFPEKEKDFSYGHPYFDAGQILITRIGEEIRYPDFLVETTIAVELGAEGHTLANLWERNESNLRVAPFKSVEEALMAVVNLDADAALVDSVSGRLFIANSQTLEYDEQTITAEPFSLVVRNEDKDLLNHLNDGLDRLKKNGTLESIIGQWLDRIDTSSR